MDPRTHHKYFSNFSNKEWARPLAAVGDRKKIITTLRKENKKWQRLQICNLAMAFLLYCLQHQTRALRVCFFRSAK